MEFLNEEDFKKHIKLNYKLIHKGSEKNWKALSATCDFCKRDVFIKVGKRSHSHPSSDKTFFPDFSTFEIQCPSCNRKSYLQVIALEAEKDPNNKFGFTTYEFYKLYNLPSETDRDELKDIPLDAHSLRETIFEALFCLEGGQYISATIMFRRGLQILAKDILGAPNNNLFEQLKWLKTNPNKLNVNLSALFHDNSELIRKVGNQGAHPDSDLSLHSFTEDDANTLHDLFIMLVNDVFVIPLKLKTMQSELIERRKLK